MYFCPTKVLENVITATDVSGKCRRNSNLGFDSTVAPLLHLLMPTAMLSVFLETAAAINTVDRTDLLLPESYSHL